MSGLIEALAGIFVSIVLFFFGYRTTVGARRERVKVARAETVRILLRLAAVEGIGLTPTILRRTIAGEAAQHSVEAAAIGPPPLIANLLYAEVMGSDLLESATRRSVLARIEDAFHDDIGGTTGDGDSDQGARLIRPEPTARSGSELTASGESAIAAREKLVQLESRQSRRDGATTALLGLLAAVLGALSAFVPGALQHNITVTREELLVTVGATIAVMLLVTSTIILRQRDRKRVEDESVEVSSVPLWFADSFGRIFRAASGAGAIVSKPKDGGADLRIDFPDGGAVLVDIKEYLNKREARSLARRLVQISKGQGPVEGLVIVTNTPPSIMLELQNELPDQIRLMRREDFINMLHDAPAERRSRLRHVD